MSTRTEFKSHFSRQDRDKGRRVAPGTEHQQSISCCSRNPVIGAFCNPRKLEAGRCRCGAVTVAGSSRRVSQNRGLTVIASTTTRSPYGSRNVTRLQKFFVPANKTRVRGVPP